MNIYRLEVLCFDDLGHLLELVIVRLHKDSRVEILQLSMTRLEMIKLPLHTE